MDMKEYLQESARTNVSADQINLTPMNTQVLMQTLTDLIHIGNVLDDVKKNIFYAKETPWITEMETAKNQSEKYYVDQKTADLIHSIVGITTESSELCEALLKALKDDDFDTTNLVEEVGDTLWYQAMLLRLVKSDFETASEINIDKLYKRFPHKFVGDLAIFRDTKGEREFLESRVNNNEDNK